MFGERKLKAFDATPKDAEKEENDREHIFTHKKKLKGDEEALNRVKNSYGCLGCRSDLNSAQTFPIFFLKE